MPNPAPQSTQFLIFMVLPLFPLATGLVLALAAALYTLLSLTLLRFGYTAALEKFVAGLPAVLAQPVRRVLFLETASAK